MKDILKKNPRFHNYRIITQHFVPVQFVDNRNKYTFTSVHNN